MWSLAIVDVRDAISPLNIASMQMSLQITPFNMKEELEEGHFDSEGHFQWTKEKQIKDNWLDNLDWVKIKHQANAKEGQSTSDAAAAGTSGLGDSSSEDEGETSLKNFDIIAAYRRILEVMKPGETISRTLRRLGQATAKISSIERFRRKKAGIVDESAAVVTELTELCNNILTKMGNMDVYEETYEEINRKFASKLKSADKADDLDIFGDDFDANAKPTAAQAATSEEQPKDVDNNIKWEFKWTMDDTEVHGPYATEQMSKWADDGYFKDGVFVKKCGADTQFHSSNRIDFDLYL